MVEHRFQPGPAHIPVAGAIDRIRNGHVISRHTLGDRACRATYPKKPTNYFLAGANFRKCAIPPPIQIDFEGFGVCVQFCGLSGVNPINNGTLRHGRLSPDESYIFGLR
jgi:hypothetical protein